MKKKCPECQSDFECNKNDIRNCDCFDIKINKKPIAYLNANFTDCLCTKCLEKINKTQKK